MIRLVVGGLGLLMLAGCSGSEAEETTPSEQPFVALPSATGSNRVAETRWVPKQGTAWQWQLQGKLDLSVDVPVYDVDWQTTSEAEIAELHSLGRHVICYVSVGSYEKYRPDAKKFPASVLGKELDGWPDERWLDIRQWDQLEPILAARFDQCRAKGFDAVEPDNVDGYSNESGFPLTADDQLTFNRRIADLAHARGMSVGLKNDVEQAAALEPSFDFAVNEECMRYDECEMLQPFLQAGKAVLHVEYDLDPSEFCAKAKAMGLSSMQKPLELGADRRPC